MFIQAITILCITQMLGNGCESLEFIDLPSDSDDPDEAMANKATEKADPSTISAPSIPDPSLETSTVTFLPVTGRRFLPLTRVGVADSLDENDETDDYFLKKKIAVIIQQTVHDTTKKVASVQKLKERVRDQAPYKAGYILSLVRKSRLMLNDLFNLAVKHRDNWKALQQLKVFEYIVHTNVDTTNLVRQLVEVHIQHLNSTQSAKKRVVLL